MKWLALKTVVRDVGFLLIGFGGIIYQQVTQQVNPWLLAAYLAMLGLPGAIGLLQLGRGTGSETTRSTQSPSPPSPSPSSSSPQP